MSNEFKYGDRLKAVLQKMEEQTKKVADFANVPFASVLGLPEVSDLTRELNELWERDVILQKYIPVGVKALNLGVIFSKINAGNDVLEADAASLKIEIPSAYRHIIIFGSGRVSGAVYNMSIKAQFNADTGANYDQQHINAAGASASGAQGLAQTEMLLGDFAGASAPAGECGSFFTFIFHSQGSLWKNAIGASSLQDSATTMLARVVTNFYTITDPLKSVLIYPTSGNLLAGCAISVYGIL